jgi:2'-5' RNA ligase
MHGIVSLLDDKHYQMVENLWAELEREFAVRGVYSTPYPHFSYQIAQHYNVEQLEPILQRFASGQAAFEVKTSGLRIFTGPHPVLYIPVVRDLELTRFHQQLWPEISMAGSGISDYYHPANWVPHITIGFEDINRENLSHIVRSLAERDFSWEITIDNVALIYDTGTNQELRARFAFGKR